MSRFSEVEEQIPLSEQFNNPLSLVPEITVDSRTDVEAVFIDLENRINQNDDWQKRSQAIQEAMSYIKGGIQNHPDANFVSLAPAIASSVTNLRSALVRWGSLFVAAASQALQVNFVSSLEIIVPALFKQLSHGTAIISNSCRFALLEIARNVPHRRTSRAFMTKLKSKANQQRQVVAEFIQIAIENWPNSLLTSLNGQFSDALKALVEDPSPTVRQVAREASEALGAEKPTSRSSSKVGLSVKIPVTSNFNQNTSNTPTSQRPHISHIPTSPSNKARTPIFKARRSVDDSGSPDRIRNSQIPLSPRYNDSPKSFRASQKGGGSPRGPMTQPLRKAHSLLDSQSDESPQNPLKFAKIPPPIDSFEKNDSFSGNNSGENSFDNLKFERKDTRDNNRENYNEIMNEIEKASPENEIYEYMPPKTNDDSVNFLKLLQEITASKDFTKLDGLDVLLPPSIVSAVKFIPIMKPWKPVLPILFEQFTEAFDDQIIDILSVFHFDSWLVEKFAQSFDAQTIFEREIMNGTLDSLRLVASLLRQDILRNISLKMKNKILKIASEFSDNEDSQFLVERFNGKPNNKPNSKLKSKSPNSKPLRKSDEFNNSNNSTSFKPSSKTPNKFTVRGNGKPLIKLNSKPNPVKQKVDIISKLSSALEQNESYEDVLDEISQNADEYIPEYLADLENIFIRYLNNGEREQIVSILKFCVKVLQSRDTICFSGLFQQLSELVTETDREIVDLATAVIVKMAEIDINIIISLMQNVEEAMNNSVDETALSTLSIIHAFFIDLSEAKMCEFSEPVMQYLQPALASNNTSVRRIVVLIFVEFRYKIPQQFHQYMEQLSMTQQKLIELYSSKRGPKK
ncbi:hypothetical protein TRFO_15748 [Tritrichomonas foetus]|uniref:TOG domain-containing protein n=1 Tax=Tritrichomonas foetus TaxID=1144522 RepID=A0A1J4KSW4_9EUKA|nr:hypothetical protein TRFO_15748 [Tritrichomonas foetus]|eukprot:OHT13976.1 hypothetical protein TRFO_15748 [Tritrichomonas foetus]